MNYVSLIGILIAMAIVIAGSIKGVNMIVLSAIAAGIVTLSGGFDMATGYAQTYMTGVGGFVTSMLPLFLTGAIFGKLMEESGLANSVANALMKRIKTEKGVITAIFFTTVILVTAGINVFVIIFAVYSLALQMFKKANITKDVMPALIMGGASAQALLPGTPSSINVLAAQLCGVTEAAAPITGFLSFAVLSVMTLLYLFRVIDKCKAEGQGFVPTERDLKILSEYEAKKEKDLPKAWLIVPPVALVLILLNVVGWPAYLSLVGGSVLMLVMFFNRYKFNLKAIFNEAAEDSQYVVVTASIVGFGALVRTVPGFEMVSTLLDKVSGGNVWIFAFIAVNLLSAVAASSLSGISLAMSAWGDKLLGAGVNPQNMCRLLTVSSMGLDSLPHNSAIILTIKYCDVDPVKGNKYMFMVTCVFGVLVGIIPVITGMLGIC